MNINNRNNNNRTNNMAKEFMITIGPATLLQAAAVEDMCEKENIDFDVRLLEEKKHVGKKQKRVIGRVGRVTAEHVKQTNELISQGKSDIQIAKAIGIGNSTANAIRNGRYDHLLEAKK